MLSYGHAFDYRTALQGPAVKGVWLMREIATVLAKFDVVLGTILFLCTVIKWYVLKARIEANGWRSMNPCEVMTLIMYTIPVFGQMCFLALMTTLDEGAARKREEAGSTITVAVGPMRDVYEDGPVKKGRSKRR